MRMRNILFDAIASTLLALPGLSFAKDLKVVNNTKKPFSISIGQHCSSIFGFMQPGMTREMSENILSKLCSHHMKDCIAEIHQSRHCSGKMIAVFEFDVKEGIVDHIVASPYTVTIDKASNSFIMQD